MAPCDDAYFSHIVGVAAGASSSSEVVWEGGVQTQTTTATAQHTERLDAASFFYPHLSTTRNPRHEPPDQEEPEARRRPRRAPRAFMCVKDVRWHQIVNHQ